MFDDDAPDYVPNVGDLVTVPDLHHVWRIAELYKAPILYCALEAHGVRFSINTSALTPYQENSIA